MYSISLWLTTCHIHIQDCICIIPFHCYACIHTYIIYRIYRIYGLLLFLILFCSKNFLARSKWIFYMKHPFLHFAFESVFKRDTRLNAHTTDILLILKITTIPTVISYALCSYILTCIHCAIFCCLLSDLWHVTFCHFGRTTSDFPIFSTWKFFFRLLASFSCWFSLINFFSSCSYQTANIERSMAQLFSQDIIAIIHDVAW